MYMNQQHSFPILLNHILVWCLSLMTKVFKSSKSLCRANAREELYLIPGISMHSANIGYFSCCFTYYCCQVSPELWIMNENQGLERRNYYGLVSLYQAYSKNRGTNFKES